MMTELERIERESAAAEERVREISAEIKAQKELKRAAAKVVDTLAVQREACLRNDPTRRRMTIAAGKA